MCASGSGFVDLRLSSGKALSSGMLKWMRCVAAARKRVEENEETRQLHQRLRGEFRWLSSNKILWPFRPEENAAAVREHLWVPKGDSECNMALPCLTDIAPSRK